MPYLPLRPECPFEREVGCGCFEAIYSETGDLLGYAWKCIYYDPVEGCSL
jgi:hypothetical protein